MKLELNRREFKNDFKIAMNVTDKVGRPNLEYCVISGKKSVGGLILLQATDGHRLIEIEEPNISCDEDFEIKIHRSDFKMVHEFLKLSSPKITITTDINTLSPSFDGKIEILRSVDHKEAIILMTERRSSFIVFPDTEKLKNEWIYNQSVEMDAKIFSIICGNKTDVGIQFNFPKGNVHLTDHKNKIHSEVSQDLKSDDNFYIHINPQLVKSVFDKGEVLISYSGDTHPVRFIQRSKKLYVMQRR